MGGALLRAYAAHWLGLVPEQATAAEGASHAAAAVRPRSLTRQPVGSRLALPQARAEDYIAVQPSILYRLHSCTGI